MDFFLSLSSIGSGVIVDIFSSLIDFFNTPLNVLVGLNYESVLHDVPVLPNNPIGRFIFRIVQWFAPSSEPAPIPIVSSVVNVLDLLGLDTTLPLWSFMLSNIGIIIVGSLALKIVSAFS